MAANLSYADVASRTGVDEKTVQRWVTKGRVPHPSTRRALADLLGEEPDVLWPEIVRRSVKVGADRELIGVYPRRSDLPRAFYGDLIAGATDRLWFGGYTSYFIWVDAPQAREHLRAKAVEARADVRFLLGDPDSPVTAARDAYEASPLTLATRIGMTRMEIAKTRAENLIEVRYTDKHVAWSVWVFDDDAIQTVHIGPGLGHDSLTLHWRRQGAGGAFDRLVDHFTCLWDVARQEGPPPAGTGLALAS